MGGPIAIAIFFGGEELEKLETRPPGT